MHPSLPSSCRLRLCEGTALLWSGKSPVLRWHRTDVLAILDGLSLVCAAIRVVNTISVVLCSDNWVGTCFPFLWSSQPPSSQYLNVFQIMISIVYDFGFFSFCLLPWVQEVVEEEIRNQSSMSKSSSKRRRASSVDVDYLQTPKARFRALHFAEQRYTL